MAAPDHSFLFRVDGTYAWGCCDNIYKRIYINDSLNNYWTKRVLCHEIVHAAMFSYGVILSYEEEEMIADIISLYGEEIIDITNNIFKVIKK